MPLLSSPTPADLSILGASTTAPTTAPTRKPKGPDVGTWGRSAAQEEVAPEVAEALARVQEAMAEAESTLDKLHTLPSAREPTQVSGEVTAT